MKTIFDPANLWLGAAPLAFSPSNKPPVALNDVLSLAKDSGPVSVDVLANDHDPEGASLTLVSANAALGSAVAEADDTVTYTPPPGISGFDTIVYEVADDLGQIRNGQVDVTITEPALSIVPQPDNTLVVNAAAGPVDITVTAPAGFAGTTQIHTADLPGGPLNLVAPAVSGTFADGAVLSAAQGLWVYSTGAGTPAQSWQWRRDGVDISGATAATYTVQAADLAATLEAIEIQSDGYGNRLAASAPVSAAGFLPSDDTGLLGWWDAADAATITESGGLVSSWADKAGGSALGQAGPAARPVTGTRSLNGLNLLDFDGTTFLEATRSLPADGDVAFHMAVVIDTQDDLFDSLLSVNATNDFQLDAISTSQFDGRLNVSGIGSPVNLAGGPFSGAVIVSIVFDRTGGAIAEVFVSNVSRASMAYTAALDASVDLRLMANRAASIFNDGAVAELIVSAGVSNRADHHAYLASKWGLT